MMYNMSSDKANKARAEKYLADEKAKKEARKERLHKSKEAGSAKIKNALKKRGKTKASPDYLATEAAYGYEAARHLLKGDVVSAIGYARRNKAYRDNRKWWDS